MLASRFKSSKKKFENCTGRATNLGYKGSQTPSSFTTWWFFYVETKSKTQFRVQTIRDEVTVYVLQNSHTNPVKSVEIENWKVNQKCPSFGSHCASKSLNVQVWGHRETHTFGVVWMINWWEPRQVKVVTFQTMWRFRASWPPFFAPFNNSRCQIIHASIRKRKGCHLWWGCHVYGTVAGTR